MVYSVDIDYNENFDSYVSTEQEAEELCKKLYDEYVKTGFNVWKIRVRYVSYRPVWVVRS